jgi:hypothetical protein
MSIEKRRRRFNVWRRIVVLCLICLWVGGNVWAQKGSEETRYAIAPSGKYLLTIASQPDCPIQVENAKLLLAIGVGGWGASYRLRNAGTKPLTIRSITLSMWTEHGIGNTWEDLTQEPAKMVLSGELIPTKDDYKRKTEIVPLTDEIGNKLGLRGPLEVVVVLIVEQVKFSDGTVYSDHRISKELQSYFQRVDPNQSNR